MHAAPAKRACPACCSTAVGRSRRRAPDIPHLLPRALNLCLEPFGLLLVSPDAPGQRAQSRILSCCSQRALRSLRLRVIWYFVARRALALLAVPSSGNVTMHDNPPPFPPSVTGFRELASAAGARAGSYPATASR